MYGREEFGRDGDRHVKEEHCRRVKNGRGGELQYFFLSHVLCVSFAVLAAREEEELYSCCELMHEVVVKFQRLFPLVKYLYECL